ncbi:MAG: SIR2 family protein [Bacteroidia bacterium]
MPYTDIIEDLQDEQAVLLIGPEAMRLGDLSLVQHLYAHLWARAGEEIVYYYERDGLFLFANEEAKLRVQKQVKRQLRALSPDEAWLQQVISLPFPLILSLTPDTFLRDAFEKQGKPAHFAYFRAGEQQEDLPKGEKGKPLIYNLFGMAEEEESLVLDYEDMFRLMQGILSTGLPTKLKAQLKRATTYVFVGFDFEKWHTQLLIRVLMSQSERKAINKYAFTGDAATQSTRNFLMKAFKISFTEGEKENETLLDSLQRHCEKAKLLRPIVTAYSQEQAQLLRQIYQGKIASVLQILQEHQNAEKDEITLLSARYNRLEEEKTRMDSRDYSVQWNQIVYALVEVIKGF